MKLFSKSIFSCIAVLAAATFTNSASADIYQHIDDTAVDIEAKTAELLRETVHYQHTSQYAHLVQDTRNLQRLASHIHANIHGHNCVVWLRSDVQKLDAEFHHLDEVFRQIERAAAHGHGHVHGDTRHVRGLLTALENCIHILENDLRVVQRLESQHAIEAARSHHAPTYSTYGSQSIHFDPRRSHQSNYGGIQTDYRRSSRSTGGFSINRGNLHFRINF